jgi:hypothetical protein
VIRVSHQVRLDQPAERCWRALQAPPERWLPDRETEAAGDGRFLVWLGFGSPEVRVAKEVELTVGQPAAEADRLVVPLAWRATGPGRLFPTLAGELGVRPLDPGSCLLSLTGCYEPPLGALGRRLDEAMLRRAAEATVRDLATAIAARVTDLAASEPG